MSRERSLHSTPSTPSNSSEPPRCPPPSNGQIGLPPPGFGMEIRDSQSPHYDSEEAISELDDEL